MHRKISQLFPVNFPEKVIGTTLIDMDGRTAVQLTYGVSQHFEMKTKDGYQREYKKNHHNEVSAYDTSIKILPNGFYYFHPHETHEYASKSDGRGCVFIGNVCVRVGLVGKVNPFVIDSFIDTTRIASFKQTDSTVVLVGVDKKSNKLYTYTLFFPNGFESEFKLITENNHDRATIGTCIYTPPKDSKLNIVDISAANNSLAVSFNNGDIRVFEFNDYGHDSYRIAKECLDFADAQLFHTNTHLVAYSPGNQIIRVWDLTKPFTADRPYTEVGCPEMKSLTISLDGAYLIGIAKEENIINFKVHCFKISNCAHHEIQLSDKVEDIAIHNQGHVYVMRPQKSSSSSLLLDKKLDVVNLGPIETIIENKSSLIKVEDYKEQAASAVAVKKEGSKKGFFAKARDIVTKDKNSSGKLERKF